MKMEKFYSTGVFSTIALTNTDNWEMLKEKNN